MANRKPRKVRVAGLVNSGAKLVEKMNVANMDTRGEMTASLWVIAMRCSGNNHEPGVNPN